MNLQTTIEIFAGGEGSGCHGENCGRKPLYHVTHTHLVSKIQKEGLRPMQTSNWVQRGGKQSGARYGSGEIHTFQNEHDAKQWAAKMDWAFNKSIGTGKISILQLKQGKENWIEDKNDPLSQLQSTEPWLKTMRGIPPDQIEGVKPFTSDDAKALAQSHREKFAK